MTSDPEEQVRLQGFGEMTLRTAVATLMQLAPREPWRRIGNFVANMQRFPTV